MLIKTDTGAGYPVAVVRSQTPVITDVRSALDVMMTAKYESGTDRIAIQKEALAEEFFILSSGLAGEIQQAPAGLYPGEQPGKDRVFRGQRGSGGGLAGQELDMRGKSGTVRRTVPLF